MMAMALSCNPSLLIADEPTGTDVTIQSQMSDLIKMAKIIWYVSCFYNT